MRASRAKNPLTQKAHLNSCECEFETGDHLNEGEGVSNAQKMMKQEHDMLNAVERQSVI